MKRVLAAFISGGLFGLGLVISGMTEPQIVLGFLDVFGAFNPQLMLVLGGAVAVTVLAFRLVLRRPNPLFAERFDIPKNRTVDAPLLLGSALFGIGWGIAGYCPGPAWVGLAGGVETAMIAVAAMLFGSGLRALQVRFSSS